MNDPQIFNVVSIDASSSLIFNAHMIDQIIFDRIIPRLRLEQGGGDVRVDELGHGREYETGTISGAKNDLSRNDSNEKR